MNRVVYSFPPIVSQKSKVLILGTMPGAASLKAKQYYADPRNAFWRIMGRLIGVGPQLPYKERLVIIDEAGLALWDSLQACVRPGSLDSSITDEVPNDFPAFFARYPKIRHVFFNGGKAETAFHGHAMPMLNDHQQTFQRLPSTSPAHAAMSLDDKVRAWSIVKEALS
jgi:TDG/mug DNA glycosylase family protein